MCYGTFFLPTGKIKLKWHGLRQTLRNENALLRYNRNPDEKKYCIVQVEVQHTDASGIDHYVIKYIGVYAIMSMDGKVENITFFKNYHIFENMIYQANLLSHINPDVFKEKFLEHISFATSRSEWMAWDVTEQ